MTSHDILKRLRERYELKDGWITMAEVTPPGTPRRFDFLAIMGWASRGHECMGFEVKVSRSDWLRELKEPAKADPLVRLCSRWWIVAPPDVVKVDELPPAWGLLIVHPEQVRTTKQAPCLQPEAWSDAVWRCLLLRLVTREKHQPSDIEKARSEGWMEGRANANEHNATMAKIQEEAVTELRELIDKASEATGVHLSKWTDFPALGKAMQALRRNTFSHEVREMTRDADRLERLAKELRETAAMLESKPVGAVS